MQQHALHPPQPSSPSPYQTRKSCCFILYTLFHILATSLYHNIILNMVSEKIILYDELRASEEALLSNDQIDFPLPPVPYSRSHRTMKSISEHLHRAHPETNYRLAIVQVLLIAIYTVVFIVLRSYKIPVNNGALIPCECVESSDPSLRQAHTAYSTSKICHPDGAQNTSQLRQCFEPIQRPSKSRARSGMAQLA